MHKSCKLSVHGLFYYFTESDHEIIRLLSNTARLVTDLPVEWLCLGLYYIQLNQNVVYA